MSESETRLLKIKEAAAILGIAPGSLYRLVARRDVPHYHIRGVGIRFRPSDLERFVNKGRRTKRDLAAIVDCKN